MARPKRNWSEDLSERESAGESDAPKPKKSKSSTFNKASTKIDGEKDKAELFWELANPKRRAVVTNFKGETYVDFREYYEKDGQRLPGKKGISLSVEQFNALLEVVPEINAELIKRGVKVGGNAGSPDAGDKGLKPAQKKAKAKPFKANIEATSDEDET